MGTSILDVAGLSKRFGSLQAVSDVTLSFDDDQVCAIIGPNGAGKSTFLNLLTGSLEPTSGTITLSGTDITDVSPHEVASRGLVKSFQTSNVFGEKTVRENVRLAAQADTTQYNFWRSTDSYQDIEDRTDTILAEFELTDHAQKLVGAMSHGESRLIEMAVTFATDPAMMLLDEPSSGMSASESTAVVDLIDDLADRIPLIVVEHNMDIVADVADRIVVLHHGEVIADGDYQDVRTDSEVRRVYLEGTS